MAKKRKAKKSGTRRRRRVSGIGQKLDLQAAGLAVAGAFAAYKLSQMLAKSSNTTMQSVAPFVGIAAGIGLPLVIKNPMIKAMSVGMIAAGGIDTLKKLKVLSGVYGDWLPVVNGTGAAQLPYKPARRVNGTSLPDSTVNPSTMSVISGVGHCGSGAANAY
jgi:hypothetical protein